jgi:hypothetical protein
VTDRRIRDIPLAVAELEQAPANRVIASDPEGLEKPSVPRQNAPALVDHKERLFEGVYYPLRLDMIATQ